MEALTRTIDAAVQGNDYATLAAVFDSHRSGSLSWQSVGQGEQRSLASHFIQAAVNAPNFVSQACRNASMMQVMKVALGHLPATVENAADNVLRQRMFDAMMEDDQYTDYAGAARILAGMRMDDDPSSIYYMNAAERTDVHVKIAECFLAEDEIAESDAAVNKAGQTVEAIPDKANHRPLILRYKSTYARVLDANRKFLSAAQRYYELCSLGSTPAANSNNMQQQGNTSVEADMVVDADDLLHLLGRAATCAILAPSGPQRQRVLGLIVRDRRLADLGSLPAYSSHARILTKMYRHEILVPSDMQSFEATLAPHQKAVMGDGLTIMERGVVEHNMIAVSKLYRTVYLTELARILSVTPRKAEQIAAAMIMEGSSLPAGTFIDQVDGLLVFYPEPDDDEHGHVTSFSRSADLDRSITSFCWELNRVTDAILQQQQQHASSMEKQ